MIHIEQVERRILLATSLTDGTTRIFGTDGDDTISLLAWGTTMSVSYRLVINGERQPVRDLVGRVGDRSRELIIDARGGNDSIEVRYVSFAKPLLVKGGRGDDAIDLMHVGGVARGGPGDDVISAQSPDPQRPDSLFGGGGDDSLYSDGASGAMLSGGAGNDVLTGGAGNDTLKGGPGIDRFFGGAGDDILYVSKAETSDHGKGKDTILR